MRILFEVIRLYIKLLFGKGIKRSYSQFGEDIFVWYLLRKKKGFYVDVGAYHPALYSNTYAFYKNGWNGIAIDPNPFCKKLFYWIRPRDKFINSAVGNGGEVLYYQYSDAAYNSFTADVSVKNKNIKLINKTLIPTKSLSKLLHGIEDIDFMNIDVEGMEIDVLKSYDWKIKPKVVAVEGDVENKVHKFLLDKHYALKAIMGVTMIFELNS